MSSITTKDGTRIYYKDWGSGPLIVHGGGAMLKVYPGLPHDMCSTDKAQINVDLLSFLRAGN